MPDYSLHWTARSSAIQRCQCCSSPIWRWPSRSQGPFSLKSAMEHWPSGTDAWQSAEEPLHEAVANPASIILWWLPLNTKKLFWSLYLLISQTILTNRGYRSVQEHYYNVVSSITVLGSIFHTHPCTHTHTHTHFLFNHRFFRNLLIILAKSSNIHRISVFPPIFNSSRYFYTC